MNGKKNDMSRNHDGIMLTIIIMLMMITSIIFLYMVVHDITHIIMLVLIIIALIIELIMLIIFARREVMHDIRRQTDAIINDSRTNKQ